MMQTAAVLLSLAVLLGLLIQGRIRPALLFTGLAALYYVFGFLEFQSWVHNYVNPSLVILVLLLIISLAVEKTVFVKELSSSLIGKNYTFSLLKLGAFTSVFSAFLNNTAVVASLLGSIKQNRFHKPSKLLIPLSYSAIFGGTMTLIGTSTNLIVNGFAVEAGMEGFAIFDFFYVGALVTIAGLGTLLLASRLLPAYEVPSLRQSRYFMETKVAPGSKLIGKSISENGLRNLQELFLVELQRKDHLIAPVGPEEVVQEGDTLIFSGAVEHVELLKRFDGLHLSREKLQLGSNLVEAVVASGSTLVGEKVKNSGFRSKFDAAIVAMKRGSEDIKRIGETRLQAGDKLVLAVGSDFYGRDNIAKNFHILSNIDGEKHLTKRQSYFVLGGFLLAILAAATGAISFIKALLLLIAGLMVSKVLHITEIKRRFPYEIVLIVGSSLAIAKVMVSSGVAGELAAQINALFGANGVWGSFIGIFLITYLLTEVITNNAAAALSFPLAYAAATGLGVDPVPFVLAVAYGASASFLSPYGYQTNLMVSSVGQYRFTDFTRIGIPVSLAYMATVLISIPIFFPF